MSRDVVLGKAGDNAEAVLARSNSPTGRVSRVMHALCHGLLFVLLLVSNVGQRVFFKLLGYVLGSYPDFILLSVSGAFVLTLGVTCAAIVAVTGGWLPETRTWSAQGVFAAIGICNAIQGFGMVLANPYVPGNLQAQLQQATIPFTLVASWLLLSAQVTQRQCSGVMLIVAGISLQLHASQSGGVSEGSAGGLGAMLWGLLFLFAQLPVALAAILQEHAFQAVPVNVFQMMFNASCAQFLALLLLGPLYTGHGFGLGALQARMLEAWQTTEERGGTTVLFGFILSMLLAQLSQALMVKYSSATFTILCMVTVVPVSSLVFALPQIMGSRAELLPAATPYAIILVFVGIVVFRFGNIINNVGNQADAEGGLMEALLTPQISFETEDGRKGPCMMASGVGIISSEYTAARNTGVTIWEEGTAAEAKKASTWGRGVTD